MNVDEREERLRRLAFSLSDLYGTPLDTHATVDRNAAGRGGGEGFATPPKKSYASLSSRKGRSVSANVGAAVAPCCTKCTTKPTATTAAASQYRRTSKGTTPLYEDAQRLNTKLQRKRETEQNTREAAASSKKVSDGTNTVLRQATENELRAVFRACTHGVPGLSYAVVPEALTRMELSADEHDVDAVWYDLVGGNPRPYATEEQFVAVFAKRVPDLGLRARRRSASPPQERQRREQPVSASRQHGAGDTGLDVDGGGPLAVSPIKRTGTASMMSATHEAAVSSFTRPTASHTAKFSTHTESASATAKRGAGPKPSDVHLRLYAKSSRVVDAESERLQREKAAAAAKECTHRPSINTRGRPRTAEPSSRRTPGYLGNTSSFNSKSVFVGYDDTGKEVTHNSRLEHEALVQECSFKPEINAYHRPKHLPVPTDYYDAVCRIRSNSARSRRQSFEDSLRPTAYESPGLRMDNGKDHGPGRRSSSATSDSAAPRSRRSSSASAVGGYAQQHRQQQQPLARVPVEIDGHDGFIDVFPNEDPYEIARKYCVQHKIPARQHAMIERHVRKFIEERLIPRYTTSPRRSYQNKRK